MRHINNFFHRGLFKCDGSRISRFNNWTATSILSAGTRVHSRCRPSATSGSSLCLAEASPGCPRTVQISSPPAAAPGRGRTSAQSSPAPLCSARSWDLCSPWRSDTFRTYNSLEDNKYYSSCWWHNWLNNKSHLSIFIIYYFAILCSRTYKHKQDSNHTPFNINFQTKSLIFGVSLRLPLYQGGSPEDGAEQGVVPAAVLHRDKPSYIAIVTIRSVSTPLCGDALCTQAGALDRTPSIQPWSREINHAKCIHIYISKKVRLEYKTQNNWVERFYI